MFKKIIKMNAFELHEKCSDKFYSHFVIILIFSLGTRQINNNEPEKKMHNTLRRLKTL